MSKHVTRDLDGIETQWVEKDEYDAVVRELERINKECISLFLHEQRLAAERERADDLDSESMRNWKTAMQAFDERDALAERYRKIELANKEMSRNDHVTFGDLLEKLKSAEAEIDELKGVLDLKNDEYVKQVGTWKIIRRLEEELTCANELIELYEAALERVSGQDWSISDSRHASTQLAEIASEALTKGKKLK